MQMLILFDISLEISLPVKPKVSEPFYINNILRVFVCLFVLFVCLFSLLIRESIVTVAAVKRKFYMWM